MAEDVCRFGPLGRFEVRLAARRLFVDGQPQALGARAFDLLAALVTRRDRIVPKDELLDIVWPGLVVEENNLQVQMSALRKVLGPQIVATVPGRGYRFVAAVDAALPNSGAVTNTTTPAAGSLSAESPPAAAPPEHSAYRGRLLVADDNKVNRLLLTRTLTLQGHRVASADNGRVALEMLRSEPFDALLLDLEMPELDGFALLEILGADPVLRDVAVIVTSSLDGVAHVARCIELGAEDYLHKPVNPLLLKARVGSSLEKKRLRDRHKQLVERLAGGRGLLGLSSLSSGDTAGPAAGAQRATASVLQARLVGFDRLMSTLAPPAAVELLDSWLTLMLNAVAGQGGVVSRADGDTLLALFGEQDLPAGDTALHAARAALEMHELVRQFNAERARAGEPALTMGVGIATGAVLTSSASAFERAGVACVGAAVERAATLQWAAEANGLEVVLDGESAAALNGRMHAPRLAGITLAPRKLPASMHTLAPVPP